MPTLTSGRSRVCRSALAALVLLVLSAGIAESQAVPGKDVLHVHPFWMSFAGASASEVETVFADMRARLGPEGSHVKFGIAVYLSLSMEDWNVDISNPAAVRGAMTETIGYVDAFIAKARAANVPISFSVLTAIRGAKDPVQTASQAEDIRSMQWYVDNYLADGWWTYSRYARKAKAIQEAYVRELGKILANRMRLYPETLVAASGDGEAELASARPNPLSSQLYAQIFADYSPFTVAEFRDWLRLGGLYAPGALFEGQGYSLGARYAGDRTPGEDTNGDGHRLNSDFGTNFATWDLAQFNWSLSDPVVTGDARAIPLTAYAWPGFGPTPAEIIEFGFDAPRVPKAINADAWWDLWVLFKQTMLQHHARDFAKWMTTSADPATGATIPVERWYSYQIPADYLQGGTPSSPNPRWYSSMSSWWTADVSPYGGLGITAFNVDWVNPDGFPPFVARTLINVGPEIARLGHRWGIIEWHPGVLPCGEPPTPDCGVSTKLDLFRSEMNLIEQYRPSLLQPFAWGYWPSEVRGNSFETALREFVARNKDGYPGNVSAIPATLRFSAAKTSGSSALVAVTSPQAVTVAFSGAPGAWTASTTQPWLQVTGGSGSGPGQFIVAIVNPGNTIGGNWSLSGTITITSSVALNSPVSIPVTLTVDQTGGLLGKPPIGLVDTPAQNATGQVGAIGVTGWVVDDMGVRSVRIYRNCLSFEPAIDCGIVNGLNLVYIGDATIVAGARPDIEAAYPTYPQSNRAAWGYLLLTNMLPHVPNQLMFGGQGTLTLYALAEDVQGHQRWLGRDFITAPTETNETPTVFSMANDTIAKPFGAIDTPKQGETVSGSFWNFGWTLTPDSDTTADASDILMPLNGSTQWVYIDGVPVAPIGAYNMCRGTPGWPTPYCDDDVASIFGNPTPQPTYTLRTANPTKHRNLDSGRGPIAAYWLDTTGLANGIHTIAWGVTDSAGRGEGIGSRYFTVLNGSFDSRPDGPALAQDRSADAVPADPVGARHAVPAGPALAQDRSGDAVARGVAPATDATAVGFDSPVGARHAVPVRRALGSPRSSMAELALRDAPARARGDASALDTLAPATDLVRGRTGFDVYAPYGEVVTDDTGVRHVQIRDLGRLELRLGAVERGYLVANGTLRDLPPGSHLDVETGQFTWAPGLGYLGTYRLAFVRGGEQIAIDVTIRPAPPSSDAGGIQMSVDVPRAGQVVSGAVTIAGWALDPQAWTGIGIDAVHVWAQRTDVPAAAPEFLGAAALGGARPDVAKVHGATFGTAGFSLTTGALVSGQYDVTIFAWSRRTARWEDARIVRVIVR